MLQTPDANLSRCMRHHNGVYTQKLNVDQIGGRAYGANAAAAVDRAKELMA
jgi:hypothetical protein